MRNLKKVLALVMAFAFAFSVMVSAGSYFADVPEALANSANQSKIELLKVLEIFVGDQNGNFNPAQVINRAEAVTVVYRLMTAKKLATAYDGASVFTDVKGTSYNWANGYVNYAVAAGITKGTGNGTTFSPADKLDIYMMATFLVRGLLGAEATKNYAYPYGFMVKAEEMGLLNDVDVAAGINGMTREQVALMIYNALMWDPDGAGAGLPLAQSKFGLTSVEGICTATTGAIPFGESLDSGTNVQIKSTSETKDYAFTGTTFVLGQKYVLLKRGTTVVAANKVGNATVTTKTALQLTADDVTKLTNGSATLVQLTAALNAAGSGVQLYNTLPQLSAVAGKAVPMTISLYKSTGSGDNYDFAVINYKADAKVMGVSSTKVSLSYKLLNNACNAMENGSSNLVVEKSKFENVPSNGFVQNAQIYLWADSTASQGKTSAGDLKFNAMTATRLNAQVTAVAGSTYTIGGSSYVKQLGSAYSVTLGGTVDCVLDATGNIVEGYVSTETTPVTYSVGNFLVVTGLRIEYGGGGLDPIDYKYYVQGVNNAGSLIEIQLKSDVTGFGASGALNVFNAIETAIYSVDTNATPDVLTVNPILCSYSLDGGKISKIETNFTTKTISGSATSYDTSSRALVVGTNTYRMLDQSLVFALEGTATRAADPITAGGDSYYKSAIDSSNYTTYVKKANVANMRLVSPPADVSNGKTFDNADYGQIEALLFADSDKLGTTTQSNVTYLAATVLSGGTVKYLGSANDKAYTTYTLLANGTTMTLQTAEFGISDDTLMNKTGFQWVTVTDGKITAMVDESGAAPSGYTITLNVVFNNSAVFGTETVISYGTNLTATVDTSSVIVYLKKGVNNAHDAEPSALATTISYSTFASAYKASAGYHYDISFVTKDGKVVAIYVGEDGNFA